MFYLVILSLLLIASPCIAGLHISVEPTAGTTWYRLTGDYDCLRDGLRAPARSDGGLLLDVDCVESYDPANPISIRACNDAGCGPAVELDVAKQVPGRPRGAKIHNYK